MKNIGIMALAVIIMGGILWYATRIDQPKSADVSEPRYESTEHGFSIAYPEGVTYDTEGADRILFSEGGNPIAEARVLTITGAEGETFENAVADELGGLCSETASSGFRCTGADRLETFTTDEGFTGYRLYLIGSSTVMTSTSTATSTDTDPPRKGPFFILPLQTSATMSKVLIVHAPLSLTSREAEASLIRRMAESVIITPPDSLTAYDDSVKAFVDARIDDLSNEAAVPGSNFEVQSIETNNGTGIVTYGKGGVNRTADFTYTVDARGTVSITTFRVRP